MRAIRRSFVGIVIAAVVVAAAPRVKAIVYGFVDTNNAFTNTGAFIVRSPTTGNIFPICSGALISKTVFLTASHCTAFFEDDLAPLGYTAFVSFDNPIPFADLTSPATNLIPAKASARVLLSAYCRHFSESTSTMSRTNGMPVSSEIIA